MKRIPIKNKCSQVEGFNTYSIEEVKKHTSKKSLWTHFRGDVYDITKFIDNHPGGKDKIMLAAVRASAALKAASIAAFILSSGDLI